MPLASIISEHEIKLYSPSIQSQPAGLAGTFLYLFNVTTVAAHAGFW